MVSQMLDGRYFMVGGYREAGATMDRRSPNIHSEYNKQIQRQNKRQAKCLIVVFIYIYRTVYKPKSISSRPATPLSPRDPSILDQSRRASQQDKKLFTHDVKIRMADACMHDRDLDLLHVCTSSCCIQLNRTPSRMYSPKFPTSFVQEAQNLAINTSRHAQTTE